MLIAKMGFSATFGHLILAVVVITANLPDSIFGASFYGASYIALPLQDAKSATEVNLNFKTHRSHSFIFLAAGKTDYCLIELVAGSIKIRINLGAGEAELASPPGLRLNDLLWHNLRLSRKNAEVNLTIDQLHTTSMISPGQFFELNINYGVFIGGLGDFSELFLGNFQNFRGCMKGVFFNGIDVFTQAQESLNQRNIYAVSWDCSTEFDALSEQPFSFVQRGAFLAYPSMQARSGGSFSCDIKTQDSSIVILYNSGIPSKSDYIALEVVNGKPQLSIDKGNGPSTLKSDISINDGLWHNIAIRFTTTYMEISVDDKVKHLRPSLGDNRYLDLAGHMYLGGIELNRRARALSQGLKSISGSNSADSSLQGCMKNVKLNNDLIGLRETLITNGIQADCLWEYHCVRDPCIEGAKCVHTGFDGYRCECDLPVCTKTDFSTQYIDFTETTLPVNLELLALQPLQVPEGSNELITSNNIDIILDYQKYGIRESGVLFHVIQPPNYGSLEVDIWHHAPGTIFTLLDLNTDKVHYQHDGSETKHDSISFELELLSSRENFPKDLTRKPKFTFKIDVIPVNDPPEIGLPPGRVLRLAENSKRSITADILTAVDPDTEPKDLLYTILGSGVSDSGHVEHIHKPGFPIETFTQEDINNGLISYVHQGAKNSRIALRVSDGIETSQTAVLRISAYSVNINLISNTGISLSHDSSVIITSSNLSFATNAQDQDLEIRFDITKLPQYGNVQYLKSSNEWQTVNYFTQKQLEKNKIRYIHFSGIPSYDEFKFVVSCLDVKYDTIFDFRVTFVTSKIEIIKNSELQLDSLKETPVTSDYLFAQTSPRATLFKDIIYNIISPPKYGQLYHYFRSFGKQEKKERLDVNFTFTQQDLEEGLIHYRFHHKSYSTVLDSFQFKIITPKATSVPLTFAIKYTPQDSSVSLTNEKLEVIEGGQHKITKAHLYIETSKYKDFVFVITRIPKHGHLQIVETVQGNSNIAESNITTFNSRDIADGRLEYQHDDSEHAYDSFVFVAKPLHSNTPTIAYEGIFHINIILRNDNSPKRVIEKVFQVVTKGQKFLTDQILKYYDSDINYDSLNLMYTRVIIPNGALYHIDNPNTQVYQFTQRDLENHKIIFKHNGSSYGRTTIWVTDGLYQAKAILEVRASEPFVSGVNNTGIIVQKGKAVFITNANLSSETNLDAENKEIQYTITSGPQNAKIKKKNEITNTFTQEDIDLKLIEYVHDGSSNLEDFFQFTVKVKETEAQGDFKIKVFLESFKNPPEIINNKSVVVGEGDDVIIDQNHLLIMHPDIKPEDIVYTIKRHPKQGHLNLDGDVTSPGTFVTKFDQSDIDNRKLKYYQTQTNVVSDIFVFDVTNGFQTVHDLSFRIEIIPLMIPLQVRNISVQEGGRIGLNSNYIKILSPHYQELDLDFVILEPPYSGWIENIQNPKVKLDKFTQEQMQENLIYYVHDDNDTIIDYFTVVAKSGSENKESPSETIFITVLPVNDESPEIEINTGLQVWVKSITSISSSQLFVKDNDTPDNKIVYTVSNSNIGYLAIRPQLQSQIHNFTQAHILNGSLVFIHTGNLTGGFSFIVSDGENISPRHIFPITAKLLKLTLEINKKLLVFPKTLQAITNEYLKAITNDPNSNRTVTFKITSRPKLGSVLIERPGLPTAFSDVFTSKQISDGHVSYKQTESISDWTEKDFFIFEISTEFSETLINQKFEIEISYSNINENNMGQLIKIKELLVEEGGKVPIKKENIDVSKLISSQILGSTESDITFEIVHLPNYGIILHENKNLSTGDNFSQQDINKGRLYYQHDHSDTLLDEFIFKLKLSGPNLGNDLSSINSILNISIKPINDQPYELVTKGLSMQVVQHQMARITSDNLKTIDADSSPKEIRYDIITGPSNGIIVLSSHKNKSVITFTQHDIDSENLWFIQDGSLGTGAFYFRVSDGKFKPTLKVFNIDVVPLSLELSNISTIKIVQGRIDICIHKENLGANTNGDRKDIRYLVTTPPTYGNLYKDNKVLDKFSQSEIDDKTIFYVQTDISKSFDQFIVTVSNAENNISNQVVNITVIPLLKLTDFIAHIGAQTTLSLSVINASELAERTSSNPRFSISKLPTYGQLKRLSRNKRDTSSEPVKEFTHEDIVSEVIIYEPKNINLLSENQTDGFDFILNAPTVQPASGSLLIILQPPSPDIKTSVTGNTARRPYISGTQSSVGSKPPKTTKVALPSDSSEKTILDTKVKGVSLTKDHVVIISIVCGVVVVGLIIIIAVRCWIRKYHSGKEEMRKEKSPIATGHVPVEIQRTAVPSHEPPTNLEIRNVYDPPQSPQLSTFSPPKAEISPTTIPRSNFSTFGPPKVQISPTIPRSPKLTTFDPARTEVSPAVPTCKVTPLSQDQYNPETKVKTTYGDPDIGCEDGFDFDWNLFDPELRQQARIANPMLRKNQYWV